MGEPNEYNNGFAGKSEKLDICRYVNTDNLSESDKELLTLLRKLQETEINKYISRNSPFSEFGKISFTRKKMICRKKPKN